MRFAAIADVHGNHLALEAVLADIAAQGIDDIVNLGDCFSGPLEAGKVAELLSSVPMPTVRGNHDRYLIDRDLAAMHASDSVAYGQLLPAHLDWIRALPTSLVYRDEAYLCHATPDDDNTYWLEQVSPDGLVSLMPLERIEALAGAIDRPLILCAHSHIARTVRLSDGRLIVNPGSVGCPAFDDVLPHYHKVETGHPLACYAILEKTAKGWQAAFRQIPYDHGAMARLAAANGRDDWSSGLATGWLR
jgi:diadenosine tetraphosphatase ApaH/serine/threonine PP2A family protein phosphatase